MQDTPQQSSGNTPAMSSEYRQAPPLQPYSQRGLVEAGPSSSMRFDYETAEYEEKDHEMADK
jgi:hypothetical protein